MLRILFLSVFFLFCCNCLFSQSLNDGQLALETGRFSDGLLIFTHLAEQNDKMAQFLLGSMYEQGKGVARNYGKAYFWLFLAARQDSQLLKYLEQIEKKLSDSEKKTILLQCRKWLSARNLKDNPVENNENKPRQ